MRTEICEFRWLHIPYREVRRAILEGPARLIGPAASAAMQKSNDRLATLGVDIAGLHVERQVEVTLAEVVDIGAPLPILKVPMQWHAVSRPELYPIMDGMLEAYPIAGDRTQLSLQGRYQPPFGKLGEALDALVLHTVAEEAIERFLEDVAAAIGVAAAGPEAPDRPQPLTEPGEPG